MDEESRKEASGGMLRVFQLAASVIYSVRKLFCHRPPNSGKEALFLYKTAVYGAFAGRSRSVIEDILVPLLWDNDECRSLLFFGKHVIDVERKVIHALLSYEDESSPYWPRLQLQLAFIELGDENQEQAFWTLQKLTQSNVQEANPAVAAEANMLLWQYWQGQTDTGTLRVTSNQFREHLIQNPELGQYLTATSEQEGELELHCDLYHLSISTLVYAAKSEIPQLRACARLFGVEMMRVGQIALDSTRVQEWIADAECLLFHVFDAGQSRYRTWALKYYCRFLIATNEIARAEDFVLEFMAVVGGMYELSVTHSTLAEIRFANKRFDGAFDEAIVALYYAGESGRDDLRLMTVQQAKSALRSLDLPEDEIVDEIEDALRKIHELAETSLSKRTLQSNWKIRKPVANKA